MDLVSGSVPKGLSSPFPSASDKLRERDRSETSMRLVLVGDRKRIWPIFIIARWLISLGQPPTLSGALLPRLVPNSQAQLILLSPSPGYLKPRAVALC